MHKILLLKTLYKNIHFFGYCRVEGYLDSKNYSLIKEKNKYFLVGENKDKHRAIIYHGSHNPIIDEVWEGFQIKDPKTVIFDDSNKLILNNSRSDFCNLL